MILRSHEYLSVSSCSGKRDKREVEKEKKGKNREVRKEKKEKKEISQHPQASREIFIVPGHQLLQRLWLACWGFIGSDVICTSDELLRWIFDMGSRIETRSVSSFACKYLLKCCYIELLCQRRRISSDE